MELHAGPPAYYEWNGIRWYLNKKDSYYRDRAGFLLHVALWVDAHSQKVPPGYEVHHIDHSRLNNDIANLGLVSDAEHRLHHLAEDAEHGESWRSQQGSEQSRERVKRLWSTRQPRDVTCAQCGTVYQSTGMRARFCSANCAARFYRAHRKEKLNL
jgi:hypothetical protein